MLINLTMELFERISYGHELVNDNNTTVQLLFYEILITIAQ